jgi:hypothetical protein
MKSKFICTLFSLALLLACAASAYASAAPTGSFSDTDKYIWSETSGWLNFTPSGSGVVVYPDHLEGYLWAENIGWIKLGSNSAGGNYSYTNGAATNWGVNRSGGTLSGYGWSETSGWINFAPNGGGSGGVFLDQTTGICSGWAWGENIGWIHIKSDISSTYQLALAPPVTLTITTNGNGTVTSNIGTGYLTWNNLTSSDSYLRGTLITLTASPNSGYGLTTWGGDCNTGTGACGLTLDQNKTVTASFDVQHNVLAGAHYYPTLAAAYNSVTTGSISIQARDVIFIENLSFGNPVSVTLRGGYTTTDFSNQNQTGYTTISGIVTVASGSVVMDRVIIK